MELVSIIIPMLNAQAYVSKTLASLLLEHETPIEIIVVNDKSTDESLARVLVFSDERIRLIDGPGRGISACMNAGLAVARGAVIMRCDADDLYPAGRIARQMAWLGANPEYAAVCGSFSAIDSRGRLVSDLKCGTEPAEITSELRQGTVRTHFCTYAVRAESVSKVGGFREYFESAEDTDLQLRLGEAGRVGYVPAVSYFYRLHASSVTHRQSNVLRKFFERTAFDFQVQRRTAGLDDLQWGRPPLKPNSANSAPLSANAHVQSVLLGRAWREHATGKRAKALVTGLRALARNPFGVAVWKSMVALAWKSAAKGGE